MPIKNLDEWFFNIFRGGTLRVGNVVTNNVAVLCVPGADLGWLEAFLQGSQHLVKRGMGVDIKEPNL
jgi:hypothetical protein